MSHVSKKYDLTVDVFDMLKGFFALIFATSNYWQYDAGTERRTTHDSKGS
jgi:glycerol-3-phosphate acyltransferase PlsY